MTKIASFTKLENEVLPKFRDSMAKARSTEDVRKFFVYAMLEVLNGALADTGLELAYEDIRLTPGEAPGYVLPRLGGHPAYAALAEKSDLAAILERFATAAGNRFKRLEKNPEKTEAKMFRSDGRG